MDFHPLDNVQGTKENSPPKSPCVTLSMPPGLVVQGEASGTSKLQVYNGFPPGITPRNISLYENFYIAMHCRPNNISVHICIYK